MYKGQPYRFMLSENPATADYRLVARNLETRQQKIVTLSWQAYSDESFMFLQLGYMMTNIWMRKYTPVDVKIAVTTSDLIGELLC